MAVCPKKHLLDSQLHPHKGECHSRHASLTRLPRGRLSSSSVVMSSAALTSFSNFAENTLEELIQENEQLRLASVAKSTLNSRRQQWNCYLRFCVKFSLPVFPCSNSQAPLYATHLARYMLASSIITYVQAVIFFHNIHS